MYETSQQVVQIHVS